jgi:hypothetical protein
MEWISCEKRLPTEADAKTYIRRSKKYVDEFPCVLWLRKGSLPRIGHYTVIMGAQYWAVLPDQPQN